VRVRDVFLNIIQQ